MRDQNLVLTRILIRADHLTRQATSFLTIEEQKSLDFDPLQIARREESLGLLGYIKVEC